MAMFNMPNNALQIHTYFENGIFYCNASKIDQQHPDLNTSNIELQITSKGDYYNISGQYTKSNDAKGDISSSVKKNSNSQTMIFDLATALSNTAFDDNKDVKRLAASILLELNMQMIRQQMPNQLGE